MCEAGQRVVFDIVGGENRSYTEHKESGTRTPLKLKNRVWEIDFDVYPYQGAVKMLSAAGTSREQLCPFGGQAHPQP